jgi:hypothetical protein
MKPSVFCELGEANRALASYRIANPYSKRELDKISNSTMRNRTGLWLIFLLKHPRNVFALA